MCMLGLGVCKTRCGSAGPLYFRVYSSYYSSFSAKNLIRILMVIIKSVGQFSSTTTFTVVSRSLHFLVTSS